MSAEWTNTVLLRSTCSSRRARPHAACSAKSRSRGAGQGTPIRPRSWFNDNEANRVRNGAWCTKRPRLVPDLGWQMRTTSHLPGSGLRCRSEVIDAALSGIPVAETTAVDLRLRLGEVVPVIRMRGLWARDIQLQAGWSRSPCRRRQAIPRTSRRSCLRDGRPPYGSPHNMRSCWSR